MFYSTADVVALLLCMPH